MSTGAFICPCCDEACDGYEHQSCAGCHQDCCENCSDDGRFETFIYNGEECCTICFQTKPDDIEQSDLLDLALTKLGTTKKRLREELLISGPERFRVAPNKYECTVCPEFECSSNLCTKVSKFLERECVIRFNDPEMDEFTKGYCCKARRDEELCSECKDWEGRRVARTLIGIRKKRKGTLLAWLPRDVLILCIIKPFIIK